MGAGQNLANSPAGGGLAWPAVKMLVSMPVFLWRMHYSGAVWPD
jgi:hypothetical protein